MAEEPVRIVSYTLFYQLTTDTISSLLILLELIDQFDIAVILLGTYTSLKDKGVVLSGTKGRGLHMYVEFLLADSFVFVKKAQLHLI